MRLLFVSLALLLGGCGFDTNAALDHLDSNRQQIETISREFDALVPDSLGVGIEFRGRWTVDFHVHPIRPRVGPSVQVWDALIAGPEVQRGFNILGWTEADLERVRDLVESVDGIGIDGPLQGGGVKIRYRRHGMGMYMFFVTDSAMVGKDEVGWDGCSTYYLNPRTALAYGGGAIGTDCMPPPEAW